MRALARWITRPQRPLPHHRHTLSMLGFSRDIDAIADYAACLRRKMTLETDRASL